MDSPATDRCTVCGEATVVRSIPAECREVISGDPATVRLCLSCLAFEPAPGDPVDREWTPQDVTTALPSDPDAAMAVAILVSLLDSLALNREEIVTVVEYLEKEGIDSLLAIDRLADDQRVSSTADLRRRRDQLAQVLGR